MSLHPSPVLNRVELRNLAGRVVAGIGNHRAIRFVTASLLAFCVSALLTLPAQAETSVSGVIGSNTTWRASEGPYVVTGNITVPFGVTLTIEADTQVFMGAGVGITADEGAIVANGTAGAPVRVQSDQVRLGQPPTAGYWNQWRFAATSVSALTYVQFDHGKGLDFVTSQTNVNYVQIRYSDGPAISQDLYSSLIGIGNIATGNTINAVLVPAGDILYFPRWGLKGIPYFVASGTVSVGHPTTIYGEAQEVPSGEMTRVVIFGSDLMGASSPTFSGVGVIAAAQPGGEWSFVVLDVTADTGVRGLFDLTLQTDRGEVTKTGAIKVVRPVPRVLAVSPFEIYTHQGNTTLTISGRYFEPTSVAMVGGEPLATTFVSATQLLAVLPNQTEPTGTALALETPDTENPGSLLTSNYVTLYIENAPQRITYVDPFYVYTGQGDTVLTVSGHNFEPSSQVVFKDLPLVTTYQSATLLTAILPNQVAETSTDTLHIRTPNPANPGYFLISDQRPYRVHALTTSWEGDSYVVLGTPGYVYLYTPFPAPPGGLQFSVTSSNPAVLSVPATVTVPEGAWSTSFMMTGVSVGTTNVTVGRPGWLDMVMALPVLLEAPPPTSIPATPTMGRPIPPPATGGTKALGGGGLGSKSVAPKVPSSNGGASVPAKPAGAAPVPAGEPAAPTPGATSVK